MELQEIFDKAHLGLRKQGYASRDPLTGDCMYRSSNGDKCGAGQLIPDEVYAPWMEHKIITSNEMRPVIAQVIGRSDSYALSVVRQIQSIHDNHMPSHPEHLAVMQNSESVLIRSHGRACGEYTTEQRENAKARLAKDFGLTYTAPEAKTS